MQANNNRLTCVDPALRLLKNLEILSLQSNLLSRLPAVLPALPRLAQLRLDNNNLTCDCELLWLGKHLRRNPGLGVCSTQNSHYRDTSVSMFSDASVVQVGTVCAGPGGLTGRSVSTLLPFQLHCPDIAADSGADQVRCWAGL